MTTTMIRTRGLTRHFTTSKTTVEAVKGIDLDVQEGELVALLGPNGAGKSTTLRMLTTLIAPTSGTAEVAGFDVVSRQRDVRSRIGYIGQGNGAAHAQRGRDELVMQGRFFGMSKADARSRADELITSLDLTEVVDRPVSSLSGGQRRRLDIAMGLIHAPELLFLDEPSTGLDPQNRANLLDHIVALREKFGTTVVLTTHYLDEADALAERVVVIDHGLIIADETPHRLKSDLVGDRLAVTAPTPGDAVRVAERLAVVIPGANVTVDGTTVEARVDDGPGRVAAVATDLAAHGVPITGIESGRATLDDVFLHLTGRSLREGDTSTTPEILTETAEVASMSTLTQTGLVLGRELRPVIRDPFSIIFGLVQPIFFLSLFAPLLIATTGLPTGAALQWFVPGVLVMIALFGTSATGSNLQMEMTTGSHERVLVTPLSRSAVMIGKALKEIVPTVVQGVIIVAVAVPFGFELHPVGAVIGLAMLALFCVGVGALSSTLALAVKNQEWMFWLVQQTLLFPLLLLAGMLLPIDDAPGWLKFLSNLNPLRYLVDAERSLFAGEVLTADVGYGALAAVIVAVGGLVIGARAMARSN